jgi:hypothetical protein
VKESSKPKREKTKKKTITTRTIGRIGTVRWWETRRETKAADSFRIKKQNKKLLPELPMKKLWTKWENNNNNNNRKKS